MAKAKTVYEAKDGSEHDSAKAANKRDALIVAKERLAEAVRSAPAAYQTYFAKIRRTTICRRARTSIAASM